MNKFFVGLFIAIAIFFMMPGKSFSHQLHTVKLNTQDTAMLLPASSADEVKLLLKLSATPEKMGLSKQSLPIERGFEIPILSRETYDALVDNENAATFRKENTLGSVPDYDQWRIVAARFIPCARPSENIDGQIVNVDMLATDFTSERIQAVCQLEHRLTAQPFDENGKVLPFAIHIINRPYRSGDPKSHELSRNILSEIIELQGLRDFEGPAPFDIYPGSRDPKVLKQINNHIVRFYGGGLLRTLAIMVSNEQGNDLAFWSGSGTNPTSSAPGSFRFSNLIRPPQKGFIDESDAFQLIRIRGEDITITTHDESGGLLLPIPGNHSPSMFPFLVNANNKSAQQEVLDVNNTRRFFLPNLDCSSCHGVTSHVSSRPIPLSGNRFSAEDTQITVTADKTLVMQNKIEHFVAFGYRQGINQNYPSVAQVLINDAAMTSSFINKSMSFWMQPEQKFSAIESTDPILIQNNPLMLNARVIARHLSQSTRNDLVQVESGVRINLTDDPTFSTEWTIKEENLPFKVPASDAQVIADLLRVTGVRKLEHSELDGVVLRILANERDEVFIENK